MSPSADRESPAAAFAPLPFVTASAWAERLVVQIDELLVEQAHLEKKAAAAAISFLFRLPADAAAQRGLSQLAREELVHFERTLRLLAARGVAFVRQPPSAYAERLKEAVRRAQPERLIDELLLAAIIEARSHERMALLAEACRDPLPEVASFYAELCAAEARHAPLYQELAALLAEPAAVAERHAALGAHEAAVLRALPPGPRLHSGVAAEAEL